VVPYTPSCQLIAVLFTSFKGRFHLLSLFLRCANHSYPVDFYDVFVSKSKYSQIKCLILTIMICFNKLRRDFYHVTILVLVARACNCGIFLGHSVPQRGNRKVYIGACIAIFKRCLGLHLHAASSLRI